MVLIWYGLLSVEASSLKEKRMVIRSFKDRAMKKYPVVVAETTHQDALDKAGITVAIVGTDKAILDSILSKLEVEWYNAGGGDIIEDEVFIWRERGG